PVKWRCELDGGGGARLTNWRDPSRGEFVYAQRKETSATSHQERRPGREHKMKSRPRADNKTHRGNGKLREKVAVITGGDSRIDLLVNNAAEQHPQESIEKIIAKQLERTFPTNIFSFFRDESGAETVPCACRAVRQRSRSVDACQRRSAPIKFDQKTFHRRP